MIPLNLIIDGRALVGNRTGIGVHTAEIAGRLGTEPPPLIASHAAITDRSGIEHCRFRVDPAPLGVWWQLTKLARVAASEDARVLWAPHGTLPPTLAIPAVVSVHDLTSITAPHRHRLKTVASFNLLIGRSLDQARFVAVVSRFTADAIIRGFAVERQKVVVIPNGVDRFFSPGEGEPDRDFILYVGTFEPRKGIDLLFQSWQDLGPQRPRLIIAGDPGWHHRGLRRAMLPHTATGAITITGFVDRERLRALYRSAICLVYPSREEGFGLPPLEAMACGTPVIASAGGAIPEVTGNAALMFPPGDRDALGKLLRRLLDDRGLRQELRERGLRQAGDFSWEKSAGAMRELLLQAAG